jgi:type II secretory pathway component GspD/PulD (secretin)
MNQTQPNACVLSLLMSLGVMFHSAGAAGQEVVTSTVEGQSVAIPAPATPGQPPTSTTPPSSSQPQPGQPAAPASAGNAAPAESAAAVRRPAADKFVPQPINQEIRRNPDGQVTFSIAGQPWEPVLQWLADSSALSLDWQELPGDSLNLITTRSYSMEEARDLINRHLLSRGFTMIVHGEIMSIVKAKELNPAMVPRISPQDLAGLSDHTICKVSFDLDWLIADEAVEELKPMLSSSGQIFKLSRTNRIEVIDTAISLKQIWELIQSEQTGQGEEQLVRAFRMKNRRADDVIKMLRELLKLQPPNGEGGGGGSMDPNMGMQIMQQMQQMQQAIQQAAAQPGGAGGAAARQKKETRLVLNQRENMILAQAPPDQMAIIQKAIEQVDVPNGAEGGLLQQINRMQIYRLESVDPQTLSDLLMQLGDLEPETMLKVDKQKRSIIAWASLADHLTIRTLVDKLDQSSRRIEVIHLRSLDAEYVAGTIRLLMGQEEEKADENPFNRRYGFYGFDMMGQQSSPKEPSFKVEADTENNRLLVNANSIEMDEIRDLLTKLGELPDPAAANDRVRVYDLNPEEDLESFRRQIERYWRRGNQLEFDLPAPTILPDEPSSDNENPSDKTEPRDSSPDDSSAPEKATPTSTSPTDRETTNHVRIWRNPDVVQRTSHSSTAQLDQMLADHRRQTRAKAKSTNSAGTGVLTNLVDESQATKAADQNPQPAASSATSDESTQKDKSSSPAENPGELRISAELIEKLRLQLEETEVNAGKSKTALKPDRSEAPEAAPSDRAVEPNGSIRITVAPDGKLIVSSEDPVALAEMEALIAQVATPRRSFRIFRLKYATPSWVTLNLKDFFKAEEDTKSGLEYDPYWGIMPSQKKSKGPRTLSRRRQPQFISDNFTSTILVRDADAKQLETIEDLIAIYDVPEPSDTRSMRVTTIFRLEHARAQSVAAAVKDVFRDLLSSNDKALEKDDKAQRQSSGGLVTFLPGSRGGGENKDEEEEPIRFKGLLSIGIDESSNTLIVSSAGTLMDTISEMIEALDKAADSSSVVQVVKVDPSVDLGLIQERLRELMKGQQPQKQPGQPNGQPMPGQPVPGQPGFQPGDPAAAEAVEAN